MKKIFFPVLAIVVVFMGTAFAQGFPSYYPEKGFQNTGRIDAVYAEESRIVIDDISYQVSASVIVRSLSSRSDSLLRVRPGAHVGFRVSRGDLIEEFWLLPGNYDSPRRR